MNRYENRPIYVPLSRSVPIWHDSLSISLCVLLLGAFFGSCWAIAYIAEQVLLLMGSW